ncbi:MAG: nitrate- and nitrite sensing domain-containing protein [Campylobacterota bacterium]|nr:nitrate- and nitrite sensing domain-containing protein [Campylobacterota bacterium]
MKKKIRIKLVLPFVILAIIFTILTITLFNQKYTKQQSLLKLEYEVLLATKLSQVIHEIQKERGLSVAFVSSSNNSFMKSLKLQRIQSDKKISQLYQSLEKKREKYFNIVISDPLNQTLKHIDKIRELTDIQDISSQAIVKYYKSINISILNIIFDIPNFSQGSKITQNIIAYSRFLSLKEYMGLKRVVGTIIINENKITLNQKLNYHKLIIKEELYKELFFKYASSNAISYCEKFFHGFAIDRVSHIQNTILNADDTPLNIDINEWFLNISLQIDTLKTIDDYLASEIINNIEEQRHKIEKDLESVTVLNIVSLLIFISMISIIVKLLQSERTLKNLINQYVITSTTDLKGVITDVSEAFCIISGYSREELIGQQHNIVRDAEMSKKDFQEMWYTIQNGDTWYGNIKNQNKNGTFYWVYAIVAPLYNNGKKIGYSAIRQDITNKKKILELNSELEQKISLEVEKNRQKDKQLIEQSRLAQMGEMINMIAHQWRQPLNAISFSSSGLELKAKLGKADTEVVLELSQNISTNIQHLSKTIDDFRNFFKPQKNKREISFSDIIHTVLNIIAPSIKDKKITIIQELKSEQKFYTYANELQQVILNILKNAEDALIEADINEPYIKIYSYSQENNQILEISDNGGGIKEENKEKIFNPYFSTKLEKEGTGLGLYMSKTIIEEHCLGKLSVRNSKDGALFQIILPPLSTT